MIWMVSYAKCLLEGNLAKTDKAVIDMLQDFATVKVEGRAEQLNQSTSAASPESLPNPIHTSTQNPAASGEPEMTEEEFAKQLQAGMADLLDELEKSV